DQVAALAEEAVEEPRDGGLLGLEARDADQRAGKLDEVARVDTCQRGFRAIVHGRILARTPRCRASAHSREARIIRSWAGGPAPAGPALHPSPSGALPRRADGGGAPRHPMIRGIAGRQTWIQAKRKEAAGPAVTTAGPGRALRLPKTTG